MGGTSTNKCTLQVLPIESLACDSRTLDDAGPERRLFSHAIAWHKHARPARLTSRHELKLSATFQEWGPRFPPDARVLFLKRIALVRTASAEERQSDNSGCRAKSGSAASGWLNGRLNASMAWLVPVASGKAAACHAALLAERHQC